MHRYLQVSPLLLPTEIRSGCLTKQSFYEEVCIAPIIVLFYSRLRCKNRNPILLNYPVAFILGMDVIENTYPAFSKLQIQALQIQGTLAQKSHYCDFSVNHKAMGYIIRNESSLNISECLRFRTNKIICFSSMNHTKSANSYPLQAWKVPHYSSLHTQKWCSANSICSEVFALTFLLSSRYVQAKG